MKQPFIIENEEVKALYDYFNKRAGYISREFDPLIILLIDKLYDYLEEEKDD
jgi:hypothetical protein